MKTHKQPETKSGTVLKLVVKYVKSEIKPSVKMAIELSHDGRKRSSLSTRIVNDEVLDDEDSDYEEFVVPQKEVSKAKT